MAEDFLDRISGWIDSGIEYADKSLSKFDTGLLKALERADKVYRLQRVGEALTGRDLGSLKTAENITELKADVADINAKAEARREAARAAASAGLPGQSSTTEVTSQPATTSVTATTRRKKKKVPRVNASGEALPEAGM